jgi:hypothetical protein
MNIIKILDIAHRRFSKQIVLETGSVPVKR